MRIKLKDLGEKIEIKYGPSCKERDKIIRNIVEYLGNTTVFDYKHGHRYLIRMVDRA